MNLLPAIRCLLLAAVVGSLTGGWRSNDQQPNDRLALLTDTQIAAAFSGMVVRPGDAELVIMSSADQFCATRAFWHGRDRVGPIRGTYEIKPGRLCTQVGEQRQCRYVLQNADGLVFWSNHEDGTGAWPVPFLQHEPSPCLP